MTKDKKILFVVIGVAVILAIILLVTLFKGSKKVDTGNHEQVVSALQQAIEAKEGERKAYELLATEKDKRIEDILRHDSTLAATQLESQKVYKPLYAELKNIKSNIDRIAGNDDSIRAAFATP